MKKSVLIICFILFLSILSNGCYDDQNTDPVDDQYSASDDDPLELSKTYIPHWSPVFTILPAVNRLPSMIASTDPQYQGNIEIVRRTASGSNIEHFWWNSSMNYWSKSAEFGSNIISDPALCSNLNDNLLQVVVRESTESGKLVHYWRNSSHQWIKQEVFGSEVYGSPTMICNNQGSHNLEVVARSYSGNKLKHYWRSGGIWSSQYINLGDHIHCNDPIMAQDSSGKIHLVVSVYNTIDGQYYLLYYTYVSSWVFRQRVSGVDPWIRPAITVYNYNYLSVLVRKTNLPNKVYELWHPGNDNLVWYTSTFTSSAAPITLMSTTTLDQNKYEYHYRIGDVVNYFLQGQIQL